MYYLVQSIVRLCIQHAAPQSPPSPLCYSCPQGVQKHLPPYHQQHGSSIPAALAEHACSTITSLGCCHISGSHISSLHSACITLQGAAATRRCVPHAGPLPSCAYMLSSCCWYAVLACGLLSLKVGVSILFSTVNGSGARRMAATCSRRVRQAVRQDV